MHYSRVMPPVEGHRYFASTAVFLNEVIKLAISLTMALYDLSASAPSSLPATSLFKELMRLVFTGDSWKLAFPAILYTLQNSLQFLAVSNLNAATFQVTYQLKILFTAIFSVTMLGRSLSMKKWLSLLLLMVGVAIVQIPTEPDLPTLKDLRDGPSGFHFPRSLTGLADLANQARVHKRSATYEGIEEDFAMQHPQLDASLGLAAVVVACVLSGLAGVYFEKVLKDSDSQVSLWVRNVQLSFYSLYPALFVGVVFNDGAEIARDGFFVGYNWAVWTTIILQALGGVVVALVVNYADSIAKNIATSISIVVSLLASVYLFEFEVTNSVSILRSILTLTDQSTDLRFPTVCARDCDRPRRNLSLQRSGSTSTTADHNCELRENDHWESRLLLRHSSRAVEELEVVAEERRSDYQPACNTYL